MRRLDGWSRETDASRLLLMMIAPKRTEGVGWSFWNYLELHYFALIWSYLPAGERESFLKFYFLGGDVIKYDNRHLRLHSKPASEVSYVKKRLWYSNDVCFTVQLYLHLVFVYMVVSCAVLSDSSKNPILGVFAIMQLILCQAHAYLQRSLKTDDAKNRLGQS